MMKKNALTLAAALAAVFGVLTVYAQDASNSKYYSHDSELKPVAIQSDNDFYRHPNEPEMYSFDKAIDGDPNTYACILDSTPTGGRKDATPQYGDRPITAEFTLDLGSEQEVCGLRLYSPVDWRTLSPKNISVYACGDPEGKTGVRPLKENADLLPINSGFSVCVLWDKTKTRYIHVRSNDCWQLRNRRQGGYNEEHYNTQFAELRVLTQTPDDVAEKNPNDVAFPESRMRDDWVKQDAPKAQIAPNECFTSDNDCERETALVGVVLNELADAFDADVEAYEKEKLALVEAKVPGKDDRWRDLYYGACAERRALRLAFVRDYTDKILYVKHFVFGGTEGLTGMGHPSDMQYYDQTTERRPGSQLCMLTIAEDGSVSNEVLIEKPQGCIRDPNLSWDASKLIFSMRDDFDTDNYSLYEMKLEDRSIRRLTAPPVVDGKVYPCCDYEPCYAPNGNILFASTRHTQINDCWPNDNADIYSCDADGNHIRRLTYDELDTNFPQITNDGRVVFMRWEYNDKNAYFQHPLFSMNPDGTTQTEFVGNNSMFPSSYIQARPIPDSQKLIAIVGGHHVPHKGKLALIDRSLGTQDGDCIEFVASSSPDGQSGRVPNPLKFDTHYERDVDMFGQTGPQYQYPYAFDEDNYIASYCPEGYLTIDGPFTPSLGVYYMTAEGDRELLAFDWSISSGQALPIMPTDPPAVKSTGVDYGANYGTFVVQDIYTGPGLEGIERGTVKKLRVVALEYRAAKIGKGSNAGEVDKGSVQTPISFNNGSWDVKHVLGEVDVESDGSVAFKVPARTAVYFQLLDEKGYCVQTMRSWATLQGNERFACLGCHENKLETGAMQVGQLNSIAANKTPQTPKLPDGSMHPLIERLEKESCLDSVENYLGVNAPKLNCDPDAPCDGFSYREKIQPILDKHCVECHAGGPVGNSAGEKKVSSLDLRGTIIKETLKKEIDDDHKRAFTRSYLNLIHNGEVKDSKWVKWLEVRSRAAMLPPYFTGSSQSPLMNYLEPSHYGVQVSDVEKRTIACWIDLLVPFCGSYTDANTWSSADKITYLYYLQKRRMNADAERLDVLKQKESK